MIDNLELIYAQDRRSGNHHGSPVSGGGPERFLFQDNVMENGLCKCGCGNKTWIADRNSVKNNFIKGEPTNFLKGHNKRNFKVYKRTILPNGYVRIGRSYEHNVVAESVLGKKMSFPHEIHHINGIRSDNRKENLVICEDRKYHRLLHARKRALIFCGDANKRSCIFCKKFDYLENMVFNKKTGKGICHPKCRNKYKQKR
jgi:hypothetical protein